MFNFMTPVKQMAVGYHFERGHPCQVWFSGFRGENLNVIFYQNMSIKMDCPLLL
jgi:hypothetical protein